MLSSRSAVTPARGPTALPPRPGPAVWQPPPLFGLHCESRAPWGALSACPLLCSEAVNVLLALAMMFAAV